MSVKPLPSAKRQKVFYKEMVAWTQPDYMGSRTTWYTYRCARCDVVTYITKQHSGDEYYPELCMPCSHISLAAMPDNQFLNH